MEHLHPDDAEAQLLGVYRALKRGGVYVCITPNRLNGPHDISKNFDEVATGFHLKKYSIGDLNQLFVNAGFSRVEAYVGLGRRSFRIPIETLSRIETALQRLKYERRKRIGNISIMRSVLGACVVGVK